MGSSRAVHNPARLTFGTTTELAGGHAIDVSQPAAVARLITQAAQSLVQTTESVG